MSLGNRAIHTVSALCTFVLSGGLSFSVVVEFDRDPTTKTKWDDMESIEAAIAYKKTPQKQPQKKTTQPEKPKDEGVSRDDKKPPVEGCKTDAECKPDETCKANRCEPKKPKPAKPLDTSQVFADHPHPSDDDDGPVGKPTTEPGDFNGDEHGWAPQTKGHPFWQKFAQDIHENFSLPEISAANGIPVGCFHITPDGNIVDTKVKERSGSPDLDDAAERAIHAVQKLRNNNPTPVPTELLGATTRWICVRFDPKQAS